MKYLISAFLLVFGIQQVLAQKKVVYINAGYKKIDSVTFNNKAQLDLFLVATIENDSVILKKLRYKEYFGTLNPQKKSQINKLFYKLYRIDTSKIWYIHYLYGDSINKITLPKEKTLLIHHNITHFEIAEIIEPIDKKTGYFKYSNKSIPYYTDDKTGDKITLVRFRDTLNNQNKQLNVTKMRKKDFLAYLKKMNFKKYYHFSEPHNSGRIEEDINDEKKQLKKYKKQIEFLHLSPVEIVPLTGNGNTVFVDPHLIIKKIFSDGLSPYKNIIVFPNGDFYVTSFGGYKLPKNNITSPENYQKYKRAWMKKLDKNKQGRLWIIE